VSIPFRRTIFGHLEFGDALALNGMIQHFAADGQPLELFTGPHALSMVRRMYSDRPNVQVWWLQHYHEFKQRWDGKAPGAIQLGYFAPESDLFDKMKWDREFYRQAKVPFEFKWAKFHLPDDLIGPVPPPARSALFHEDQSRGYSIDPRRLPHHIGVIPLVRRPHFWDWLPELRAAEELHFIDSAFLNLADLLWCRGLLPNVKRLAFHDYARRTGPPELRAPWEILR
jgi:hypothetical protein